MATSWTFGPGDALINAPACLPELSTLMAEEFDALYFLDLCAGIDAAVLHETLYYIDPGIPSRGSIARALYDESALKQWTLESADPLATAKEILGQPAATALLDSIPNIVDPNDVDAFSRMTSAAAVFAPDISVEATIGVPIVVSAHLAPLYLHLSDVRKGYVARRIAHNRLAKTNEQLGTALHLIRSKVSGREVLPFPPVAFEVFCNAVSIDEIPQRVLDARHRFKSIRRYFKELDETLSSENATFDEQLRAEENINKAMLAVLAGLDLRNAVSDLPLAARLLTELTEIVPPEKAVPELNLDDVSWGKLAGKLIAHAPKAVWRWRVRALHGAKTHYLRAADRHLREAVERHFHLTITSEMLRRIVEYERYVARSFASLDVAHE